MMRNLFASQPPAPPPAAPAEEIVALRLRVQELEERLEKATAAKRKPAKKRSPKQPKASSI
jgi:HAMP domain-containing protein